MKIIRCENGHFYDGSIYPVCPHCNHNADAQWTEEIGEQAEETVTMPLLQPEEDVMTTPLLQPEEDAVTTPLLQPEEDVMTMPLLQPQLVTGWLVCVKGKDFGRGFSLKSGSNRIGSSREMDVVLKREDGIAGQRHAEVFYDAQRRSFTAKAGACKESTYLNHEVVRNDMPLHAYDILSVGNVDLMFIPCCGDRFGWEDVR